MQSPKQILEKHYGFITLLPGLSQQELAQFRKQLGGFIPADIEELLLYSAGFDYSPGFDHESVGSVRFTGHYGFEFVEAFPRSITLLPDGCGNFWVVDINPESGAWGAVFYACHDPAVIGVQAPELATFLSQILEPAESNPKNALNYVRKEAAYRIWREDPWLMPMNDSRILQDPLTSNFARQLPENMRIADLRSKEIGSGFSWGRARPNADVRRCGANLVFAVEQKGLGFFERIWKKLPR